MTVNGAQIGIGSSAAVSKIYSSTLGVAGSKLQGIATT
jgi:hypothetical protein